MDKRLFSIGILILSMFIAVSCDHSVKTATYHVYNNSQFQVTKISVPLISLEKGFKDILEPGEDCTLISEWYSSETFSTEIKFHMNGEDYGCREQELAATDTRRFKPYKRISNGATITVKIYDDHWEW